MLFWVPCFRFQSDADGGRIANGRGLLKVGAMDIQGIREAMRREPFEPFAMRLADGRSPPVGHPEFVAVHPRRVIVIAEDGSWSAVEPLMVVSLDYDTDRGRSVGDDQPGDQPDC